MKSIFSQFFKSSLFNHVMRLAIVVVCLSYSADAAAAWYSKVVLNVPQSQTGLGSVYASTTNSLSANATNEATQSKSKEAGTDRDSKHTYYYFGIPSEGYLLDGFYSDDALTQKVGSESNGAWVETVTASSDDENRPTTHNRYANFRRYYLATLYGYNVEKDQFETTPLGNVPEESAVYTDMLEINVSNFEKLYKLSFNHPIGNIGDIVPSSEKFIVDIKTIGTDTVMVVKNKGAIDGQVSDAIKLYVKNEWNKDKTVNGIIATLNFTVTNEPIYVTLNPAEDLTGRYTYTQNTTGLDEFSVTTSAVVKQMITVTDYSFTFNPTPEDPSKYQFEKWVIKDKEGNVVEERIEPNLSYTFQAGQSITPVFTTFDRAVFIVKSEPAIQYTDLQQALDRAAALTTTTGKNQTVVVTVDAEGKRKGGRLVQGTYTITNGVTFLIPGEKSYEEMKGDLKDSHFQEEGSDHNAFCTLSVDDDTKIIVKNGGSISLYAKLVRTTTYTNGYITFNYGHMILGRNCQINVENGGQLHAFGFITGDPSSHVTMESGSLIYEPFTMTDWRGGSETSSKWVLGRDGKNARVFPIGQYYVQSVEVPLTFKAGAREKLSCSVDAGVTATVNMDYISNYSDTEGLFGLGDSTSLTRTYNPSTDRVKYAFNGIGTSKSKVKLGCMNLKLRVAIFNIDINSKDFVMPIQNNIDIDVKNTTIDVKYDLACLPASTMRVHDDAIINVERNANVYIYDRGARRFATDASDAKGFGGYWMSQNKVIVPLNAKARPGGIQYGHTNAAGKFTAGRTEEDLVDASWIINGDMNIHGALYTVCGDFAEADSKDPEPQGGADISSEGSGKINVYNIGTKTTINQWDQANAVGAVTIPITKYLLLHNDLSKDATAAYTPVKNENNQNLSSNPLSYTYYQHDGTWRLPIAGITGIKLYDAEDHEITNFYVTLPNDIVTGYLLATLEPIIEYDVDDFDIQLSAGNIAIVNDDDNKPAIVNDGKQLKIPVVYTPKNIHGEHRQTLTITNIPNASFDCDFKETLLAIEDYNPIFEAPTTMNIYGRVSEANPAALLIKPADKNITTLSEVNPNMVWTYEITSTNDDKEQFDFKFGEGDGNKLAGAQVIFTPNSVGEKKAKLILTATYKDAGNPQNVLTKVHNVELVGNGLIIDNTMEFNNVGTITTSTTNAFNLLCNVNSTGELTFNIVDGANKTLVPNNATYTSNEIIDIQYITIDGKGNYLITPKRKIGQVTVEVFQKGTTSHSSKTITTTIIVVGDPKPLEGQVCLDENTFPTLTEDLDFVEYDATSDRLKFVGDGSSSTWTAQFASAPGVLTFTPQGDGYWAVQESMDGVNWSEIIWWTQLPADKEVYVTLTPRTRRVKISYRKINEIGSITSLCISPFSVYAETTKSYVPVKDGSILPTSIVFTHATPDVKVSIEPNQLTPTDLSLSQSTSVNLGGVLNTFYQTTVTLSGGANIPELNDAFNLIAKQGDDDDDAPFAVVVLATYDFPKPLPMKSDTWVSDDAKNNINGYDEAEYYNHYMVSSKNVKWDADPERRNLVFLNPGSKEGEEALRQVVFGYMGLPDELRFESAATGWKIEQSSDGTSSSWVDLNAQTPTDGKYTIPLTNDPQYVRITYEGTEQNEVLISNLIIEGFPSAVPNTTEVVINKGDASASELSETFQIDVRNLPEVKLLLDNDVFSLYYQNDSQWSSISNTDILTNTQDADLAVNKKGKVAIKAVWKGEHMVDEGYVQILNPNQKDSVMAIVHIVGKKSGITASVTNTGIWTGVPDGNQNGTTKDTYTLKDSKNIFEPYTYHEVNLAHTFDENQDPLFDYLIIFGETTTTDNNTDILQPTAEIGSNAKTPYYIYKRDVDKKTYEFVNAIANANSAEKGVDGTVIVAAENVDKNMTSYINVQGDEQDKKEISVYITGFCPYATTGYTKNEEGVFLFRGTHGDKLDVYLDNCHIYSRNKSEKGTSFYGEKEGGETYSEGYARGSGGVLVFENMDAREQLDDKVDPFEVNIHTRGNNLLNSNYGCFFGLQIGNSIAMKAYQVSSPIQVHMFSDNHVNKTKTTLNFDDIWPTGEQTNGYLALKKQANNAPSIDMGNKYTEVNFNGGRIKLQNSQIVSGTYKTTLAISYRAGFFGAEEAGIKLCHGIGTDAVDGVVNFNDGTVTVERMKVAEEHRQYYLMDLNNDGTESEYTTCLRTPKNTFIKGGSICRVRACQSVTSKGGGPKEGVDGRLLGQYVYNVDLQGGKRNANETYTITVFPSNITDLGSYNYGLNSITPDEHGNCYFWIPDGYGGVTAEKDVYMATWKACMTKIGAGIPDVAEGEVGGDIRINEDEEVQNFLYCQLDKNIHDVISAKDDKGAYTYQAPLEVPSVAQSYFNSKYTKWAPNKVGEQLQHQVLSENSYTIANRVYYITTATADVWKTFTAPFDVANIYVVETFKEDMLEKMTSRSEILKVQAQHNADFAAFFGVAMAMGTTANFEGIYNSYIEWAKIQDKALNLWNGRDKYTIRGMQKLTPYFGNNWRDANFYLNKNTGIWNVTEGVDEDGELTYSFDVQWKFLKQADTVGGTLLHKGQTYSLMFPYCPGCDAMLEDRTSWDYWSGKFLIFESTSKPQTINGRDFLNENIEGNVFSQNCGDNQVIVSGNSTFAKLETTRENIHVYDDGIDSDGKGAYNNESFVMKENAYDLATIQPTTAFLYGYVPANQFGMPAKRVTRDGRIIYGESGDNNDPNNGTTTGSHTPTIGGGNSLFITAIDGGVNIAVAAPQTVQVVSATGNILYNGYVTDNVNVPLPINGIYVVKGENEAQKIFF